MIPQAGGPVSLTAYIALSVLGTALLLALYRLVVGPSLADRVVALDLMAMLLVGMIGLYAVVKTEPVYLRVALVMALINFVGTVAFAFYLHRRALQ